MYFKGRSHEAVEQLVSFYQTVMSVHSGHLIHNQKCAQIQIRIRRNILILNLSSSVNDTLSWRWQHGEICGTFYNLNLRSRGSYMKKKKQRLITYLDGLSKRENTQASPQWLLFSSPRTIGKNPPQDKLKPIVGLFSFSYLSFMSKAKAIV